QRPEDRAEALASLALKQANQNEATAYQTLVLWQTSTEGGSKASDYARGTAAVSYGLLGDFADAEQTLSVITKPEGRQWPLWNLTRFLVNKGNQQEAIGLAHEEKDSCPKLYALLGTAEGILDNMEAEAGLNDLNTSRK